MLCFAPTRSGKGVGLVVPTLLTWPGSAILRRFDRSLANLAPAIRLADRALVLDDSSSRARLLLDHENEHAKYVSRQMPPWAKRSIHAALHHEGGGDLGL